MKVIVAEIPREGLDIELDEAIRTDLLVGTIRGQLRVEKIDTEVQVRGDLAADLGLQCSRCLKDFTYKQTTPVDVVYHPTDEFREEETHELRGDELDMDFYFTGEIDLSDLAYEQVILNIPMKPLCQEACQGICIVCGADLNAGNCTCAKKTIDPRFESLRKLLNPAKGEENGESNT
jgi:uncharacterized protein